MMDSLSQVAVLHKSSECYPLNDARAVDWLALGQKDDEEEEERKYDGLGLPEDPAYKEA